jgi:hypothetical protein
VVLHVLPGLERLKPVPELARVIAARASPDAQVGFCNVVLPSFVYYLGRPITELDCLAGPAHPVQFFTQYPETWIVTSDSDWEALRPLLPGACVAARRPLFDLRLENILTGQPPPDVLLVTNKCR